jgi:hypothetical protein
MKPQRTLRNAGENRKILCSHGLKYERRIKKAGKEGAEGGRTDEDEFFP